ncbi:hypothetical protein HAZT_HAZT007993 [Hyalella azteca]|uniref:Coiled-coil domain-containing protein 6 n=1 Tax=Hyalella azteca TaxID=294128 RepID=A0A6A0HBB3_HYAAZ|nr:hypothetical protein HAZT_HAZT007993 [Hyalella azteca]
MCILQQARAEQEEEYISNTLLKKIQTLKKEKESLALNYEQEEECLTNDLSRKLVQLRNEKVELEQTLEQEQEALVNKLMRKIEKLETETQSKQNDLETLRREKIELENTLEQEQEALVNKLWKRMDKLEAEKRLLQGKLEQPISNPPSPADFAGGDGDAANNISSHIQHLRNEVTRMRHQLTTTQDQHERSSKQLAQEERITREENKRLQRRLQEEVERREALCRHLSESESSLDLEEETRVLDSVPPPPHARHRVSPTPGRPLSPGSGSTSSNWMYLYNSPMCSRCPNCNAALPPALSSSPSGHSHFVRQSSRGAERFVKPSPPPPSSPLSSLLLQQSGGYGGMPPLASGSARAPVEVPLNSMSINNASLGLSSAGGSNGASLSTRLNTAATTKQQRPPTPETMSLDHPAAPPSPMDISRN